MLARGIAGELRVAGRVAAALGPWSCSPTRTDVMGDDRWVCTAETRQRDVYWLAQAPAELRLQAGPRVWRWRCVVVEDGEGEPLVIRGRGAPEVV